MYSAAVALLLFFSWLPELCSASSNSSALEALVIPPSEYFEGNDGPWSTFHVRVGTPEQVVRILVSTASPETMVVLSDSGCLPAAFNGAAVPPNCAVSRGVPYNTSGSSSWNYVGTYAINGDGVGLEANLGYVEKADFALETLAIGLTGPSLKNQTVAGIATAEPLYLGIFGLNNQPVNYSSLGNYSAPSFLTTLKSQGLIPSVSWSYTAGAQYRLKQVYGQLIFSGYDTSRFDAGNMVSLTMAGDITRDLVVYIQSISYSGSNQAILLNEPIQVFIDSTDPNLWLPDSVCDAFEKAFGLTADNTTGLYLVNDTHNDALLNSDATVSFRLSDVQSGGQTVTVTLPYNAFALTAKSPLVSNSSYYFPLKRAANSTQYTLGRTFLQEAYISADYERGVFNLSACVWNQGAVQTVVTIPSKDESSSTSGGSSSTSTSTNPAGLSPGAIAGIVIGCVLFVAIIGTIIVLLIRRRNIVITYAAREPAADEAVMSGPIFNFNYRSLQSSVPTGSSPARTEGDTIAEGHSLEMDGSETHNKVAGQPDDIHGIHELQGESSSHQASEEAVIHELPGSTVAGLSPVGAHETAVSSSSGSRSEQAKGRGYSEEPPSPLVSTMDTAGWRSVNRDDAGNIVSPVTPVHHGPTFHDRWAK